MKLIKREKYLSQLIRVIGTPDIKVLTGVRRSGKSELLKAFKAHVEQADPNANVIHVDFNLPDFEGLAEYHALYQYVKENRKEKASNFVLIDEVQMCEGFERAINGLHASGHYDIYVTGSNAFLMSSDLATLFTGRTFAIEVFPFSFAEFVEYFQPTDIHKALDSYVRIGGMAGSYVYATERERMKYVADVYETLIVRDIKQKHKIRDMQLLMRLSDFMMDNVSNITSARSIADCLKSGGEGPSNRTIGAYMDHLCEAYAFYKVRRYDLRGKKYLASGNKYYLADHSFRYALLGFRNMDYGRVYENIVAIELMRRGWSVYDGVLYKKEIDFVATRGNEKIYLQVSDNISGQDTFQRECDPLLRIRDAYPKMLIANTLHPEYDYEGIRIIDLAAWLHAEP